VYKCSTRCKLQKREFKQLKNYRLGVRKRDALGLCQKRSMLEYLTIVWGKEQVYLRVEDPECQIHDTASESFWEQSLFGGV